MRAVWLTDLHLVFLRDPDSGVFDAEYFTFVKSVCDLDPDVVFITGDIGEAPETIGFLSGLDAEWKCPIYFVLGNHDYYRSSIAEMRRVVTNKFCSDPRLTFLTAAGVVKLTDEVGLVGHDGWPDGRDGDYGCDGKQDFFNDFKYIEELKVTRGDVDYERWPTLKRLADEAATHLEDALGHAVGQFQHVYVLTHFPPFREVAFLKGRMVDSHQSSRCVSKAVGDVILRFAEGNPDTRFTVLCGHMHSKATYEPRENLVVFSGSATYGAPGVASVFEF